MIGAITRTEIPSTGGKTDSRTSSEEEIIMSERLRVALELAEGKAFDNKTTERLFQVL